MQPPNQGLTTTGTVALAGQCWDANGNPLPPGSVMVRIINGCIATVAITQVTTSGVPAGALTIAGVAPTVAVS